MNAIRAATRLTPIALALAATACHRGPDVPSNYEVIGRTDTPAGVVVTLRDTGTGCEFTALSNGGLMPRNERSADGASVKQRCVITGEETSGGSASASAPGLQDAPTAATASNGQPSFGPPRAVGEEAQAQAVRDAVRAATEAAPPAQAAPSIPPPTGRQSSQAQSADDDVESQLRK